MYIANKKIETFRPANGRGYESSQRHFIFCFLITVLFCLTAAINTASAATYYLDAVNGDDSNPGTSEQPWKTLERALANSGASPTVAFGDTVKLRDGNYGYTELRYSSPAATSWDDKITYTADDGHDPVIQRLFIVNHRHYLEFNNLKIRPPEDVTGIQVTSAKSLRFIDLDYEGVWNTDFSDLVERNSSGYDALSGGFYITGGAADNLMDDITIQGCTISKVVRGITIACWLGDEKGDWIIKNNNIHTTSNSQVKVQALNSGSNGHILVADNHIHDYYSFFTGIDMSHASGVAVKATNVTVQNNIIHATGSTAGIGLYQRGGEPGVGFSDVIIQNNLIYDNANQLAVRLWDVSDSGSVIFRNNTVIGWHSAGSGATYYYTVLHIRPFGWYTDDGLPPAHCSVLEIYNNIVVGRVYFDNDQGNLVGLDEYSEDYNYFYSATSKIDGYLTSHDNTTILTTADYDDTFESGFFVNPDYSPALHRQNLNDGYKLTEGSPAIDFGNADYAPISDILGVSRVFPPDAGCYEYVRPVGYWKFNDGNGIIALDSSGNSNTATLINGPAWTGQGELSFDGIDDAVEIPTANWDVSSGTVTLWAKAADLSGTRYLFGHTVGSWSNRIQLYADEGSFCLGLGDSHSTSLNIENLALQTWYHIALTWDGTDYVVYVDGIATASGTYTSLTELNTSADIGNTGNASFRNEAFNGIIDEVRVYNRALTADEVSNLALVFLPIDDKEVEEGLTLTFEVRTKDLNQEVFIEANPNLPFEPNDVFFSNIFSWTPTYGDAGSYEVTFVAPHGEFEDYEKITITVNESETVKPVYRFWSSATGDHFYTIDEREKDKIIENKDGKYSAWFYEDIAYYAYAVGQQPIEASPIWRFWSSATGDHFYTISESEKDKIIVNIDGNYSAWFYEGVAWYAYAPGEQLAGAVPIWRFWSSATGDHFYTIKESEKDKIIANIDGNYTAWFYEDVAWYAYE